MHSLKLDWARYKQSLPTVNIPAIGSCIYSIGKAASEVTLPGLVNDVIEKKFVKNRNFLTIHSQETHNIRTGNNVTFAERATIKFKNAKHLKNLNVPRSGKR